MSCQPLSETSVLDYLRHRPALAGAVSDGSDYSVREVDDGNLNLVFIVEDTAKPGHGVVLKQTLPYLRVAGESWPLTRERVRFETDALRLYNRMTPGLAPEVWTEFARKFDALWQAENKGELVPAKYWNFPGGQQAFAAFRRRYIAGILRDTVGVGGGKLLRRMMGIVSVWDITRIEDPEARAAAPTAYRGFSTKPIGRSDE